MNSTVAQALAYSHSETVVVAVGWSAGSKTHRGYRAVKVNPETGEEVRYTSHTACGTRGGWAGLGAARVMPEGTPITCGKCNPTHDMDLTEREQRWETGTVRMASGQPRMALRLNGEVQVQKTDGKSWFTTKDVKVIASFKA